MYGVCKPSSVLAGISKNPVKATVFTQVRYQYGERLYEIIASPNFRCDLPER